MAEPTYVSSGTYWDGSSTTPSAGVPSGTSAGRVVVIVAFVDGNPLPSAPTPPSGFVAAPDAPVQIPATSGSHSLYVWAKRLTGPDAGSYTVTLPQSRYVEMQAHLYQNVVASGDLFDPSPGAAFQTTSSTTTPAISCTSLGPDRRLIFTATNWGGGTWTAPTGHTKRMQGGAGVITLTDRSWPTASSTGNVTATCTSSDKRNAWLGALIGTTPDASGVEGELDGALPALTGQADGTVTASGGLFGSLGPLGGSVQAAARVHGTTAAILPAVGGSFDGAVTAAGTVAAALPPLGGQLDGAVLAAGGLDASLPPLTGSLDGALGMAAVLDGALPALAGSLDGAVRAGGSLAGTLGAVDGSGQASVVVRGGIDEVLPALVGEFSGTVESQGGVFSGVLPPLRGGFTVAARVRGSVGGLLAAATASLAAAVRVDGVLSGVLPALGGSLDGEVRPPVGALDARLPALIGAFEGTSEATDLPPANPQPGPPRLGWPAAHPQLGWPAGVARTRWTVRPPTVGGE